MVLFAFGLVALVGHWVERVPCAKAKSLSQQHGFKSGLKPFAACHHLCLSCLIKTKWKEAEEVEVEQKHLSIVNFFENELII